MVISQGDVWWADLPEPAEDSVANASQVIAIDKDLLFDRVGRLPRAKLELVFAGLDAVLGR